MKYPKNDLLSKSESVLLILICGLALFLRTVKLGDVPPGLNRDEAAIGYTAFSLLKTGKDEYGKSWPVSLKSFGDWKLPAYIYVTIPAVATLGLREFSVRLPSAVFGTLTVLLTYFLARDWFRNRSLGLVASSLLAVSPWHIFFSRVASEANLAVFLTALSLFLYLRSRNKSYLVIPATITLALTLLTYHGNHVFTPLFFGLILFFFRKQFTTYTGRVSVVVFIFIFGFVLTKTLFSADKTKISGLISLNDPAVVHEQIVKNRLIYNQPLLGALLNNKFVFFTEHIVQSYLLSFSPEFLFIRGGNNGQHNIPEFGNLYLIEAPFVILGLYFLFAKREKSAWFWLLWLFISPIGAALTKDAPHSARQLAILPGITIVTAYGIVEVIRQLGRIEKTWIRYLILTFMVVLFMGNITLFLSRYFVNFPYKSYIAWGDAYKEMVRKIMANKPLYDQIVVARPDYSPYIYYLFYTAADPQKVQTEMLHYPPTGEGFEHVKDYDGIEFRQIDWAADLHVPDRLYIDWVEGIPPSATSSVVLLTPEETKVYKGLPGSPGTPTESKYVFSHILDHIDMPDGHPYLYLIETRIASTGKK